jgi:hypothetical protein
MQVDLYRQREREKKRKIRLGGFWFGNRILLFGEKIALADVGGRWAMLAHGASFFLSLSLSLSLSHSVGILLHLFLLGGYQTISRKNFSTYRENR